MKETPFHKFLYKIDENFLPPFIVFIIALLWFGYFMTFINFKYNEYRDYPCIGIEKKHNNNYLVEYGTRIKEGTWSVDGTFTIDIPEDSPKDKTKYKVSVYETRESHISLFGLGNKNNKIRSKSYKLVRIKE